MSKTRQLRHIPSFQQLPRPVYARVENWDGNGSQTDWHSHRWGQLSYAFKGVLSVKTPMGHYIAPPQFAIWLPAEIDHQVVSASATAMRSLYIAMHALPDKKWQQPRVCEISPLVRELIMTFSHSPADYNEASATGRLVQVLLDQLQALPAASLRLPLPEDRRLLALCEQLQNHHDQRPLALLAQDFGLSARSISRLFKAQTGLTFRQWRQRLRLFQSLEGLRQGESVTRVALDSGYDSVSAFVAAFHQLFGNTPGQYFASTLTPGER